MARSSRVRLVVCCWRFTIFLSGRRWHYHHLQIYYMTRVRRISKLGKDESDKNMYTSALDDPTICSHLCLLALEICCFDLESSSSFEETENSFLWNDTKDTAS